MSDNTLFTERYLTVAEANRRNYANVARYYVEHVGCVVDADEQKRLADHIDRALGILGELGRPPVALDACGGAGNAAMLMQERRCDVTLTDISPEMIQIYREACEEKGYAVSTHVSEIASFFIDTEKTFDLMVFSSALHHLENPIGVLALARSRLAPGGVIATVFDPIRQPRILRLVKAPLHWLRRAKSSPRLVLTRAVPVLKRLVTGGDRVKDRQKLDLREDNVGHLAEFHGGRGFDVDALLRQIEEKAGLQVLVQERNWANCPKLELMLRRLIKRPNEFQLILTHGAGAPAADPDGGG